MSGKKIPAQKLAGTEKQFVVLFRELQERNPKRAQRVLAELKRKANGRAQLRGGS